MTTLVRIPGDASAAHVAKIIQRDGVCIVEDLVSPDVLDRVSNEIQPYIDKTCDGHNDFTGYSTRRTGGLAGRSPSARELVMHPLIVAAGRQILASGHGMQLMNTEVISIGDSETVQPIHRDQEVWPYSFPPEYVPEFSVMWPLNTDFSAANGATRVVVGSHHGPRETFEDDEVEAAVMRRGSVLIWTGSTYHGGGANRSGQVRQGVNIAYSVSWLRQEENQFLAVPPSVAAELDDDLLRLMGYDQPIPGLGNGVDRSHPLEVLRS
jgi:ectoine hydroxylase-related dioxygenase (phytanoyl-CoA dioxygenase family)